MNLTALASVLLCTTFTLLAEVYGWRGMYDTYWYRQPPWDKRFELHVWSPIAAGGGWCYGFTGEHDQPWLGTTDWITKPWDPKSYIVMRDGRSSIMYKKKPLYGWFHLKLTTSDASKVSLQQVLALVESANDVYGVAGSFVRSKFGKGTFCDSSGNAKDKYDYKPCQWATDPFILAHNTFARKRPSGQGETTYEWNVKIDFPLCHIYYDENAIYFRFLISQDSTSKTFYFPLQKWIYLQDHNYGAPDPEPPKGATDLDCSKELDDKVTWVRGRGDLLQNVSLWYESCNTESTRDLQADGKVDQFSWGGRCGIGFSPLYSGNLQSNVARVTNKYHCRRKNSEYKFKFIPIRPNVGYPATYDNWTAPVPNDVWGKFPEINDYLMQALEAATKECKSDKCTGVIKEQTNIGVSANSTIGRYIYAGRQGHGILVVVACLFVYPLTNFVSRYFKGTFMTTRYIANVHAWYAVHIYGTLTTMTLLVTGVGMGIYAREYLGYSFHVAGRVHVALGYGTCLLFLGGIISNALRCSRKASWNCSIILHACFGVFFYYFALVTIAVAVWIPGSQGGKKKKHFDILDTIRNSTLVVITLLFPIFEIIVHVFGTIQMCKRDVRFGVLRDWACFVAIPRVAAGEQNDEAGTGLKSILFVVYLLGASIATIIALVTIGTSNPEGHYFGPMTFTHVNGKLSTENIDSYEEAEDVLF